MAGLFEGVAPPDITKTTTTAQQAPQYLTDYLTSLAQAGQTQLGQTNLIAPMSDLQKQAYANAPGAFARYQTPLDQALTAGKSAMDVSSADISKFYNPYQQQVIDEMQKQSDINLQRSVLPGLKALGVGGGQFGGSRVGNIGGQALADIASRLQAQQTEARAKGFETALDAALKEQGQQAATTSALSGLGLQEQQAATSGLKSMSDLGAQQLAYEQSKIEAPLTRAANVAALLRGYQYPTTTTETYKGPGSVYGPSTLQQIAGLGSLIGAAFPVNPTTGAVGGLGGKVISGASDLLGNIFSGGSGSLGSLTGGGTETGLMGDYGT
jgi:hypothetical protein